MTEALKNISELTSPLVGGVSGEFEIERRLRRSRFVILCAGIAIAILVVVANQLFDLKDREVYRGYYASLDSCQWLGCFLVSDSVRSPTFLSAIIFGHRLGLNFDITFTLMSLFSLALFVKAMRASTDPASATRFVLISIALGTWLYLIQVKLFMAFALYLYSHTVSRRWLRLGFALASVLTHESIMFYIVLEFLWRPRDFKLSLRTIAVLGVMVAVIAIYLGATSNVFLSTIERIQRYNEYAEVGDVPAMSRLSLYSAIFFLFAMIGLLRFKVTNAGAVRVSELKILLWMFMPWLIYLVFADNGVFATRLSELALLHTFLVMPIARNYRMPSRSALLVFALTFGAWTLLIDVLFA